MKALSQQPPLTLTLAAFAGAGLLTLAAVLAPSWARLGQYGPLKIASPQLLYPQTVTQGTFGDFAMVTDRPLFNADRKKDPAPPPSPQSALPSLDNYRLVGVIVTADTSLALIERRATKSVIKVTKGDNLDGRTIANITDAGVTFAGAPTSETLSIPKAAGALFESKAALASGHDGRAITQNNTGVGVRDTN